MALRADTGGSLGSVPTLVLDPPPADFEALLERRRQLGHDLLDEVWEGVYHMNPAPHQRHAHAAQQLAELLGAPAREAGLVPMISIFKATGSPTSAVVSGPVTPPITAASSAAAPSSLINRPSSPAMIRRLAKLPTPLDTSIEKITTVSA